MSDFYQNGSVATLHNLDSAGLYRLESELQQYSRQRPIGLVLPALYTEFERPALAGIVEELGRVDYLHHVVLALGRATKAQYLKAREFMSGLPCPVAMLWLDSPRMQALFRLLDDNGLSAGEDGKGRSCWLSYGYLMAAGECDVIALHDCDILNYSRSCLARLCYPVVHPNLDFDFAKGYYARVSDRMNGRVTRLFMTPLLRALEDLAPGTPLVGFLDSFRYSLAGEFAMKTSLARLNRIPCDWGLEVGVLAEVHRNCPPRKICQVDMADRYDHKHQELSADDAARGLRRMTGDIAKSLFRTLAAEGVVLSEGHFRTLGARYVRLAEEMIDRYYADATMNGLEFDRHAEERAVSVFARSLSHAAAEFLENPLGLPLIPSWNRVTAAIPDFFDLLLESVALDNQIECAQAA